ncbi:transposase [Streptomyces sp. NPDC096030]|uniref:transposase n=1 Tax=Streptomyces sp. NPDC096030 TaxID=3155423 RepID=UPI0033267D1B
MKFARSTCGPCPVREQCTSGKAGYRQLTLHPKAMTEALRTARADQAGRDWQADYALRCGVEGTIRQAVAVTGSRRARYRGLAKTHLEHVYSAVALNFHRLHAWWHGRALDRRRTSHLARLELTLAA